MGRNLYDVSREWASRSDDERFLSLDDLHRATKAFADAAREKTLRLDEFRIGYDDRSGSLHLVSPTCTPGYLTNWSFGQLCQRIGGGAGGAAEFIRSSPPSLMAPALERLMRDNNRDKAYKGLLVQEKLADGAPAVQVRAITGEGYGRIYNHQVVAAVMRYCPESAGWQIPAASYADRDPLLATTLYASDRDVFGFLCRPKEILQGHDGGLSRGFIFYNSEVGAQTFGIKTFIYDFVCDNRIVWGVSELKELKIRHSKRAPEKFLEEAAPQLLALAAGKASEDEQFIKKARSFRIASSEDDYVDLLTGNRPMGGKLGRLDFSETTARAALESSMQSDRNDPFSAWGAVEGLTNLAREIRYADVRVTAEQKAGRILDMVPRS